LLRIGLSSGALYPYVATESVASRAAGLGVRDLELMLQTPSEYAPSFLREVRTAVNDAGCHVHALHTFQSLHPLTTPNARRTADARVLFQHAIDGAVELGARAIVWHGLTRTEAVAPGAWDAFLRIAAELGAACAEAGVTLAVENVSSCALATVRDVLAFAARLSELSPAGAIGFAFDPFQAAEAGANPFMVLAAMEGALVDVHLSDHRESDAGARHVLPGTGDLPWPALIRAIASAGYDGPMMLEAPVAGPEDVASVRTLLDPLIAATAGQGDPCAEGSPAGVLAGIRLFNQGRFYEAHEELEHEWHAERRPIRRFYQGILQIGVGFHHARGGNHTGAILLLTDGIEKVSAFVPACQGWDTSRLVLESQRSLQRIAELGPDRLHVFDWGLVPQVHAVVPEDEHPTTRTGDLGGRPFSVCL
jgi:sugar phosphate isomerase/epimerase/predicted metal-dependent hydrolase